MLPGTYVLESCKNILTLYVYPGLQSVKSKDSVPFIVLNQKYFDSFDYGTTSIVATTYSLSGSEIGPKSSQLLPLNIVEFNISKLSLTTSKFSSIGI